MKDQAAEFAFRRDARSITVAVCREKLISSIQWVAGNHKKFTAYFLCSESSIEMRLW
jgi:hypothetical protein